MAVLRHDRRPPPKFPISAFGPRWADWITTAAEAAACPPDYVAAPLLAAASALIGHARWAQATPGWKEPPHLWLAAVGESGNGKSPGADCLMRDVLPEIERRMLADFPDRLRYWRAEIEFAKAIQGRWRKEVRGESACAAPGPPPLVITPPEPQMPRLRQHDVTVEKVAELLGNAAPKGLLIVRDELAGWIAGMNAYHAGGRAFWVEAYGGRPYRVERKSDPAPIIVPRLAVSVYGGTQPDRLVRLMRDADDGLLGRMLWVWPEPVPFRLGHRTPQAAWAIRALDRLRELDLQTGDPPSPIPVPFRLGYCSREVELRPVNPPLPMLVPLMAEGQSLIERFARAMQHRQRVTAPFFRSALGEARGQALRLALVLELLWWSGEDWVSPPPNGITPRAFNAAASLIGDYFILYPNGRAHLWQPHADPSRR
jgi:hypothetical protein